VDVKKEVLRMFISMAGFDSPIRYQLRDLLAWIEAKRVDPITSR